MEEEIRVGNEKRKYEENMRFAREAYERALRKINDEERWERASRDEDLRTAEDGDHRPARKEETEAVEAEEDVGRQKMPDAEMEQMDQFLR